MHPWFLPQFNASLRLAGCLALVSLLQWMLLTRAAAENAANTPPGTVLLLDNLGRVSPVSTNQLSKKLLPANTADWQRQFPTPLRGAAVPEEILHQSNAARTAAGQFQLFPSVPPPLMPYLASQDEFGNTAAKPGALLEVIPLEPYVQRGKYWFSEQGVRYSLEQTIDFVNMTEVMQGDNALGFYTFDLQAKWALFNSREGETAGWISTQIEAKTGLGDNGQNQDARRNLGSVTDPTGIWSSHNGFRIPELAWQQSFNHGEFVAVAGMVSQGNYFDGNSYANSGRGQFINSALIDTMVVPLADYNFGVNLQWQPDETWYALLGSSVGNGRAGVSPWTDFSWDNWSLVGEFGYSPKNFLGLGPGIYRVQPFVGQSQGAPAQTGIGFDFQQQLGEHSPFGWFGRFGTGGHEHLQDGTETVNVGSQIGTGLVLHAPLQYLGLVPRLRNDVLGLGFVWSHLSESTQTIYHPDEYVLETFYTLQLSPLARLQPDVQILWNPAYNPEPGPAAIFQLQFVLSW